MTEGERRIIEAARKVRNLSFEGIEVVACALYRAIVATRLAMEEKPDAPP